MYPLKVFAIVINIVVFKGVNLSLISDTAVCKGGQHRH